MKRTRCKPKRVDIRDFVYSLFRANAPCVQWSKLPDEQDHFFVKWTDFLQSYRHRFGSDIELPNLKNMVTRKKNGFKVLRALAPEGFDSRLLDTFGNLNPDKRGALLFQVGAPVDLAGLLPSNATPVLPFARLPPKDEVGPEAAASLTAVSADVVEQSATVPLVPPEELTAARAVPIIMAQCRNRQQK